MAILADFKAEKPTWCPGCGDFGVLNALQRASVELGLDPEEMVVVSGIGCSGKLSAYFGSYGLHSIHGRSLPTAQGVKLANRELTVLAAGGDGDGFGIGLGHFIHAMRRNIDITYLVMDNHIYGLTTGQTSPTSDAGMITKTAPTGAVEEPVHPLHLALVTGCGFVAQGFSGDIVQLATIVKRAIAHKGFSFVNIFSPCVTYNKQNTYEFYKSHVKKVEDDPTYDAGNRFAALERVTEANALLTGVLYEGDRVTFEDGHAKYSTKGLATQEHTLSDDDYVKLLADFR
ncbi:MAG: 2-oxoacid:ferredoxin oxidoreductase subunit beta [Firmicutes bacterium]|nr:2-oxoacid:ferredoxin oxidoreductase subunit beta [Bacillota bacterium]